MSTRTIAAALIALSLSVAAGAYAQHQHDVREQRAVEHQCADGVPPDRQEDEPPGLGGVQRHDAQRVVEKWQIQSSQPPAENKDAKEGEAPKSEPPK